MTISLFLFMLLIASILTSLVTEATKKMVEDFATNGIAAASSIIIGCGIGIGYHIGITPNMETSESILLVIALIIGSWLCAMLGYDKIKQTILQFKYPTGTDPITTFINAKKSAEEEKVKQGVGKVKIVPDSIPTYPPSSPKKR